MSAYVVFMREKTLNQSELEAYWAASRKRWMDIPQGAGRLRQTCHAGRARR